MQEKDTCACHTEEKRQSGECCKQEKPNALDEFWTSLGEPINARNRPHNRNI